MSQQESETEEYRNPFDVVAEQFTQQCRAGLNPSIDEYANRYPNLAEKIRNLLPSIQAIEQLGSHAKSEKQFVKANAVFDRNRIEQIGDYRIVREIGRGGMGVVYEAIQQSLGRHVAIKLLMQTSTSPQHVQRFEREARTAANLHHTNIVQVYGVGTQDGLHYYVMQLIDGLGLDRVIAKLRKPDNENASVHGLSAGDYRSAAELGRSVAEALEHAHEHETLHRDIKPANLMIDAEGNIWVTDFGLAKAMEGSDVSRTGEVLGTLRFMAPEQFAGKPDRRSDVYSLGLTIYELLTLQPAWDETNHSHLLSGSNARKPQRIKSPRVHDPEIPRDLETIVLKACALDPTDRYQSAGALADDLENYLEGRPINARPPYSFEVLGKWCRRNPALAALSGVATLLLTLIAAVASSAYLSTNAALKREQVERSHAVVAQQMAEQEQQHAEKTLRISLRALDRVYERFVPDRITSSSTTIEGVDGEAMQVSSQAMLSKDTAAFLEDILGFYDEFASQDSESLLLKREAAKANRRTGDIHRQLGEFEKSIEAYDKAVSIYQSIGESELEIARIETLLATVFQETRETDFSEASFYHARRLLEAIVDANADSAVAKYDLARTLYLMARRLPPDQQGPPGPPPDALAPELSRAIELLEALRSEGSQVPSHQLLLALCYRERDMRPGGESGPSIELLEDLCERYPGVPEYEFELADTFCRVPPLHAMSESEIVDAAGSLQSALQWIDPLVDRHPNIPQYQRTKAHAHYRLGILQVRSEDAADEGRSNFQQAIEAQAKICQQFPDSLPDSFWLAQMRERLEQSESM